MKYLFYVAIIVLLLPLSAMGTSTGNDGEVDKQDLFEKNLEEAIELFYQTKWNEANELFRDLKEESPDDPRPYFFESMMPFWEYFLVDQRSDLADLFLEKSATAVEMSEKKLSNQPNDTTMVLLLSGLHGYRSLVAAGEKRYRIAMQSGITGFNYTRKLLSIDSDRPDAQIGRGMFYYMVGSVPREVRWLTNAVGISGDIEMGFRELEKASASESAIKHDARMMLMYLHEKEENFDDALEYAEMLTDRFPTNVIFHFKAAELHEATGSREKAIESYRRVISEDNRDLVEVTSLSKKRVDELYALGFKK